MSTIKVTNVQNPSAASAAITLDTNGQATLNGLAYPTSGSLSGRNRIINGDMRIDQRNAGASVTPTSGAYTLDRWALGISQASKVSVQQNSTSGFGFNKYVLLTVASTATVGSTDYFQFAQSIEGLNIADLDWGTAYAKTVTLSFYAYSSVAGTFGGSIKNGNNTRSYPFTYSLSAATWTRISIAVPGDTSGTWATDNTGGLSVTFSIGMGSTYSGTAGSWASANYGSATGATSLMGTSGATFALTGVQLEAGSVATPFERRSYGQELALCQRYCYAINATEAANYDYIAIGSAASATSLRTVFYFPVTMRSAPSLTTSSVSNFAIDWSTGPITVTGISIDRAGSAVTSLNVTVASGLTANNSSRLLRNNTASPAQILFSSEL